MYMYMLCIHVTKKKKWGAKGKQKTKHARERETTNIS